MIFRLAVIIFVAFAATTACSSNNGSGPADSGVHDDAQPEDAAAPDAFAPDAPAPDAEPAAPYTIQAFDAVRISSHGDQPNFHRAFADIDFRDGPFAGAQMILDLATTCYPFENWRNNPPPPGQNWPADCDAFDRNLEVTLDPATTATDAPGIELVRAITPFGGPLSFTIDVTDVANGRPGVHRVGVLIPTYSDGAGIVSGSNGGWNVSLRFEMTPGPAPRSVLAVIPLVNTDRTRDTGTSSVAFTVPEGTASTRIEYRVTGHGGGQAGPRCIGPAEEFCRRQHELVIDDQVEHMFEAWRTDCDQLCTITHQGPSSGGFDYCLENPCGAIQSVRAPRANWCPGSVTPPVILESATLAAPGEHRFEYRIDTILAGGVWRVSAVFFAFGP